MGTAQQFKDMSLGELRDKAKQAGIVGRTRMSKGQLVTALTAEQTVAEEEEASPAAEPEPAPEPAQAPPPAPAPQAAEPEPEPEEESRDGEEILIHFLEDGFTALGSMWYRGQELLVVVGSDEWNRTLDANGDSWLDMGEMEQAERHGKIIFRRGPWPGRRWEEGFDPEAHDEADIEALKRADKMRQRTAPPPGFKQRQRANFPPPLGPKARTSG